MGEYLSPGVYVEEVPSAIRSIAGVSTSTAGFIGVMPAMLSLPARFSTGNGSTFVNFNVPTTAGTAVLITNFAQFTRAFGDLIAPTPADPPPDQSGGGSDSGEGGGSDDGAPTVARAGARTRTAKAAVTAMTTTTADQIHAGHRNLAHAVLGFFNNGGSRCFVVYVTAEANIQAGLDALNAIDEVAIVCAPGVITEAARDAIITSCALLGDRFAILDGPSGVADLTKLPKVFTDGNGLRPKSTKFAAFYYPWLNVFDPGVKLTTPGSDGTLSVPPSGHVAGIYARVDTERGLFKSPANEAVRGALSVVHPLSKIQQDGLNPKGVNCIRGLNGNIFVWGARTVGGDDNQDSKYISVSRTMIFLRESIQEGTQWAVFEPNTPALWQTLIRNVSDFLTSMWRAGALFGATPAEAFHVKCDVENNPPEERERGKVVMDIGVAIVRPAEFVIFRVSQFTGSGN
jgi:uncharacterized protein